MHSNLRLLLAMDSISSFSVARHLRAAAVPLCSNFAYHSFNSVPAIHSRSSSSSSSSLGAAYRQRREISRDGDSRIVANGRFSTRKSSSMVFARSAEIAAATSATSLEESKTRADSYFLTDSRPVILFDGVCNMCNGGVNFMLDNDAEGVTGCCKSEKNSLSGIICLNLVKPNRKIRFAALQSDAGRALLVRSGRSSDDISSIVLVDKDRVYIKSEAILRIAQYLGFPYPNAAFLAFAVPLFLRDVFYDTVANNRYSVFGKTNTCRLSDPRFLERFLE